MGHFHPAVENETAEMEYLRSAMKVMMKTLFPSEAYECHTARELLLEILTQNILRAILDLVSNPFWLHRIMVLILTDDVPDVIDNVNEAVNDAKSDESLVNTDTDSNRSRKFPVTSEVIPNASASTDFCTTSQVNTDEAMKKSPSSRENDESDVLVDLLEEELSGNCKTAEESNHQAEQIIVGDFRPIFFVGENDDNISNHSVESDHIEPFTRLAPEGCSPPKDFSSISSAQIPQSSTFQDNQETDLPLENEETPAVVPSDDISNHERKEIYRIRNKKWNQDEDRIVSSPLALLSDASTYHEIIDVTNVDTTMSTAHSSPDFSALKIEYGPDLSHIDPAALIKETPRILFAGVHIPETEKAREPGTAGHYTLYCIEVGIARQSLYS